MKRKARAGQPDSAETIKAKRKALELERKTIQLNELNAEVVPSAVLDEAGAQPEPPCFVRWYSQEHEACTALSDFAVADGDVPACLECVLGPLSPQDRAQAMCSTDALQLMGLHGQVPAGVGKLLFAMCATGDAPAASLALEALHALRQHDACVPVLAGAQGGSAAAPHVSHEWMPDDAHLLKVLSGLGLSGGGERAAVATADAAKVAPHARVHNLSAVCVALEVYVDAHAAQHAADPLFTPALPFGRGAALPAALLRSTLDPAMAAARPQAQHGARCIVDGWGDAEADEWGARAAPLVATALEGLPDLTAVPKIVGQLTGTPACEALAAAIATEALSRRHDIKMPQGESSVLANAEHLLSHFGGAVALLRRLTPPGAGQASSWHVLATLQLLHVAARPLLRAQTEAAFRGEAPSAVLRKHLEPLLEKLNHGLKSSRNTAGLALDDVAQSMRARMLCDTLLPLYSEAGEVLRATARAHETVDMCED